MQKWQALGPLGPGEKMMEVLKGGKEKEERSHETKNPALKDQQSQLLLYVAFFGMSECGCTASILAALATSNESPTEEADLPASIRQ